ncbi:MAG: PrsW family glutamic-type intramembrane protease [Acidobacteriota bacterium]
MMTLVLVALAVAPGVAFAMYISYRDNQEKEPIRLLLRAFLIGFIIVAPVSLAEAGLRDAWNLSTRNIFHLFIDNYIVIGFTEEVVKFFILWAVVYNRREFSQPYDGILYGVMVGMGFATSENIAVVLESGLKTALLRLVTTMPAHWIFAVLMGYFVGLSKFRNHSGRMITMGIVTATLFHGTYDFCLSIENIPLIGGGAVISLGLGIYLSFKAIQRLLETDPMRVLKMLGAHEVHEQPVKEEEAVKEEQPV